MVARLVAGEQRGDEALFGDGRDRHVEQDERGLGAERLVLDDALRSAAAHRPARDTVPAFADSRVRPLQQRREIGRRPGRARPASMAPRRPSAARRACAPRREGSPASRPPARSSCSAPSWTASNRARATTASAPMALVGVSPCRESRGQREAHHQLDDAGADDAEQPAAGESRRGRTFVRRGARRRHEQSADGRAPLGQCGDRRLRGAPRPRAS